MTVFDERAETTKKTLDRLKASLQRHLGDDSVRILRDDTCVYVVGSGGRGEMSETSDVDLFVTRVGQRSPSEVDAFQVRQAITRALHDEKLPDPSQGGEYLKMHTAESLCERMGTPDDDAGNTLTARMLLLLESGVLLGEASYEKLLQRVIEAYWKNASDHDADYQPFVLVNDIVRYWRILLLNYVAKNAEKERELEPPALEAERRLRSYKLRFSRCMTCFSVLAALLSATATGCVTRDDVLTVVKQRPVDRLCTVRDRGGPAAAHVEKLLGLYGTFLQITAKPKGELIGTTFAKEFASGRAKEGREFGDAMFALLQELGCSGRGRELFRHMVV